jgi:hypothetical protein
LVVTAPGVVADMSARRGRLVTDMGRGPASNGLAAP